MTAIQKRVVKWGKRNPISRRVHAKDDEEEIANWKLDLDKIRRVFDVCSFNCQAGSLLTFRPQAELATNVDADVSEIRREASDSNATTPSPRPDVSSALVVPEARHDISKATSVGSDGYHDIVPTHSIASEVQHDPVNVHKISSSTHPNTSKNKDADIQNRAVGARTIPAPEQPLIIT